MRAIDERREKTSEKITRKREKRIMLLEKKLAIKLLISKITTEKVGSKNKEVAEANCSSPHGSE